MRFINGARELYGINTVLTERKKAKGAFSEVHGIVDECFHERIRPLLPDRENNSKLRIHSREVTRELS